MSRRRLNEQRTDGEIKKSTKREVYWISSCPSCRNSCEFLENSVWGDKLSRIAKENRTQVAAVTRVLENSTSVNDSALFCLVIKVEVLVEFLLIDFVLVHEEFFKFFDAIIIFRFLELLGQSFKGST